MITAYSVRLEEQTCITCGITFAFPSERLDRLRSHGGDFWCPNGHSQCFTKTEIQILREQLEAKEKELRASKCETLAAQQQRETAQANLLVAAKKAEKLKRRISAGVCPCCHRTVKQLAAHIKSKHPDYAK